MWQRMGTAHRLRDHAFHEPLQAGIPMVSLLISIKISCQWEESFHRMLQKPLGAPALSRLRFSSIEDVHKT